MRDPGDTCRMSAAVVSDGIRLIRLGLFGVLLARFHKLFVLPFAVV